MSGWRRSPATTTIKRMNETEIDIAIADLEKRGYELVKKGTAQTDYREFKHRSSSYYPTKLMGVNVHTQWVAVMRYKGGNSK